MEDSPGLERKVSQPGGLGFSHQNQKSTFQPGGLKGPLFSRTGENDPFDSLGCTEAVTSITCANFP